MALCSEGRTIHDASCHLSLATWHWPLCSFRSLSHTPQFAFLFEVACERVVLVQSTKSSGRRRARLAFAMARKKASGGRPDTAISTSLFSRSSPFAAEPNTYTSRAPAALSAAAASSIKRSIFSGMGRWPPFFSREYSSMVRLRSGRDLHACLRYRLPDPESGDFLLRLRVPVHVLLVFLLLSVLQEPNPVHDLLGD